MDFRSRAIGIVESAFYDSLPDVRLHNMPPGDFSDWAEQPLGNLFPEPDALLKFLGRVVTAVQAVRFHPSEQSASSSAEDSAISQKERAFTSDEKRYLASVTGAQLVDDVEAYLTPNMLRGPLVFDLYSTRKSKTPRPDPPEEAKWGEVSGTYTWSNRLEKLRWGKLGSGSERYKDETGDTPRPAAASSPASLSEAPPDTQSMTNTVSVDLGGANASLVRVFYASDRMQLRTWRAKLRYIKERSLSGKLHYGECEISVPKAHKLGKLETPSILKLEFRPDPEKHVVLQKIQSLEEGIFLEHVAASVAASSAKEAFVFIHGYKVSFEDAARRTGQIAFDLHFVGAPIFYSWPSNGRFAAYLKDETNIAWSTPHFQRFLSLIAQHSGAKRIHIIAHSMGNRAVCDALKALSYDPNTNLKFNHLVLAAPDIDADTFRELAATLQKVSGRITLYESSKDKALQASKKIHGNPRAGEPLLVIAGLDTIDASAIDTDFLGHSYFSDNWPLLSDIHSILFKDTPPAERFGLTEMDNPNGKYYAFRA